MIKKSKNSNNIGYVGNVTVKVVGSNKKIKKQYKIKNKGYAPLFEYIAWCLGGNTQDVASLCPMYIATYNVTDADENNFNVRDKNTVSIANPVVKSSQTAPIMNEDGSYTLILSFTVPGAISISADINCMALYCEKNYLSYNSPTEKEPSAVFVLEETISVDSGDNIIVVWELNVGNK